MEKRLAILKVLADQNQKSIDRLDRSIFDLRSDMNCRFTEVDRKFTDVDRKFTWLIGMQFTTFIAIIGIFAKLMGYNLGMPSMYDTDSAATVQGYGLGVYDLMGSGFFNRKLPNTAEGMCKSTTAATCVAGDINNYKGSSPAHPSAFLKWYMNWVTPERISGTQNVALGQVETNKRIVQMRENPQGLDWNRDVSIGRHDGTKQYGQGEYFLMENRQRVGYDAGLPGCGLLIYSVDETVNSSGTVAMNDEAHKLVDLVEADALSHLDSISSGNSGDVNDFYPGGTANRTFNSTSSPNSNLYGGRASGVSVTNMTNQCLATMSADVAVTNEATLRKVTREESAGSTIITEGSSTGTDSITISINTQPLSRVSVTVTDTSAPARCRSPPVPRSRSSPARSARSSPIQ
jgi:hypothetical protein